MSARETIKEAYERLHRMETDEIVDYAYDLEQENKELKGRLKKIEEYLTSYESISTIQGLNDTKENKNLDKKHNGRND